MRNVPKHPSERPIRPRVVKSASSYTRLPHDEPLTPGLRRVNKTNAIDFTARIGIDDQGDD